MPNPDLPGKIEITDVNLYSSYGREFQPGEKIFWLKQSGVIRKFSRKAKGNLGEGFDLYHIALDSQPKRVLEVYRGQLRLADSVVMHQLLT